MWKSIPGFSRYEINQLGVIRNTVTEKVMKQRLNMSGYWCLNLVNDKGAGHKYLSVHRALALAFIPNPLNKPCINHINGVRGDYSLNNLEWCTYSENTKHSFRLGISNHKGERNSKSKLTREDVGKIKARFKIVQNKSLLAREFGVHVTTIYDIVTGRSWV